MRVYSDRNIIVTSIAIMREFDRKVREKYSSTLNRSGRLNVKKLFLILSHSAKYAVRIITAVY